MAIVQIILAIFSRTAGRVLNTERSARGHPPPV